jgi:hypothetical protein
MNEKIRFSFFFYFSLSISYIKLGKKSTQAKGGEGIVKFESTTTCCANQSRYVELEN